MTERVAGDDHVPREVDDLRAPKRRRSVSAAAVGRHERRAVAVLRRPVEEQRAVRFDPDDGEHLPVSRRPRLGGGDADPIPDPPFGFVRRKSTGMVLCVRMPDPDKKKKERSMARRKGGDDYE